jgi:hypothetical protein
MASRVKCKKERNSTMLKPNLQSEEGYSLQEFLATTLNHVETLHETLTALMMDVARIRRTLLDGPEDGPPYQSSLGHDVESARPLLDEDMRSYDEMIKIIASTERWVN